MVKLDRLDLALLKVRVGSNKPDSPALPLHNAARRSYSLHLGTVAADRNAALERVRIIEGYAAQGPQS